MPQPVRRAQAAAAWPRWSIRAAGDDLPVIRTPLDCVPPPGPPASRIYDFVIIAGSPAAGVRGGPARRD
jgi:hypothetical protein